ncbi:hypothetical protein CEXT_108611 [Caerostris extrusa]|uniref:Uncharacterized protein n=1 Tax=Caerostris extrusa TaxID=172846 RepID=A0AAV4Y9Q5_CAEEX|nr:hypothetical protein CEXT_108611 [Caerostris extrusa]
MTLSNAARTSEALKIGLPFLWEAKAGGDQTLGGLTAWKDLKTVKVTNRNLGQEQDGMEWNFEKGQGPSRTEAPLRKNFF